MQPKLGSMKPPKGDIAIVISRFNTPVTDKLLEGALDALKQHGLEDKHVQVYSVPGAYEIPIVAQKLLSKNNVAGVIALGAVIRGETAHFDYVAGHSSQGLMDVMLSAKKPLVNGILTTENAEQAFARCGGTKGHKGFEAAEVLLEMINLLEEV